MTAGFARAPQMRLHHVGLVVANLEAAIAWYTETFGMEVAWREADTDVDPVAIALPEELHVRLCGAGLTAGGVYLELHQYYVPTGVGARRPCDTGYGHIAWHVTDIHAEHARLAAAGVEWVGPPRLITSGALAGVHWAYGRDPWGNVIEITTTNSLTSALTERRVPPQRRS